MSVRNSLYGQSLMRNANSFTQLMDLSGSRRWVFDWFNPPKPQLNEGVISNQQSPTPSDSVPGTPQTPKPCYNFKVKTWIAQSVTEDDIMGDENDFIDLNLYPYTHHEEVPNEERPAGSNDLTDADIRGAVGGGEGGDNLFASSAAPLQKKEAPQEEAEEKREETEEKREETEQEKDEGNASEEKDVKME